MPTFPSRAMRELTDAGDVRRAIDTRRVMHDRDLDYESRASALYEELRTLSTDDLRIRSMNAAGSSRVVMIAEIVAREVQPTSDDVGEPRKGMGSSDSP